MNSVLQLSFDIGHSSIGWAVLETRIDKDPALLGCGSVIFPADDCLASTRRGFRRQRRHIRATRLRIARMKRLFSHLGVLTTEQLDAPGCAWPWLLAARVLRGGKLLSWAELWDVLRWYAHNRGYDGNKAWTRHETATDAEGNEKKARAHELLDQFATKHSRKGTMAEVFCDRLGLDPLAEKKASPVRFRDLGAAFPREGVEAEVEGILYLQGVEPNVIIALMTDHTAHAGPEYRLPARYGQRVKGKRTPGGLLFGQLVPRFENRIISTCPIMFQRVYDAAVHAEMSDGDLKSRFERERKRLIFERERNRKNPKGNVCLSDEQIEKRAATHVAEVAAKVPGIGCVEFLRFRWAMQLANVSVATADPRNPRPLSVEERSKVNAEMEARGFFTPKQFKDFVRSVTGTKRDNLDRLLALDDADRSLVLDPARKLVNGGVLGVLWPHLGERLQKHTLTDLRRGKSVTVRELLKNRDKQSETGSAGFQPAVSGILPDTQNAPDCESRTIREHHEGPGRMPEPTGWKPALPVPFGLPAVSLTNESLCPFDKWWDGEAMKKSNKRTRDQVLDERHSLGPQNGRAAYTREVMREVHAFVLSTDKHPMDTDGPLYRTEAIRHAQLQRAIDEQTNNHLVRHRLRLLDRLHSDILKQYAGDDKTRIERVTVEVNRNVKELSGKTAQEQAKDQGQQTFQFRSVEKKLTAAYEGNGVRLTPGLVRKGRIAEDLAWACPYTGKPFDALDLLHRRVDKDHIIPRSQRASDSLDSLVVTYSEINKWKGNRTAVQFVEEEQGKPVPGLANVMIKPLSVFLRDVDGLDTFKGHDDDKRRKKNRQRLLKLKDYIEKEFTPGDLTKTSQLVRLAAEALQRSYLESDTAVPAVIAASQAGRLCHSPVVTSLPGSVTGTVRKSWNLIGCLTQANANVLNPDDLDEDGKPRVHRKTEIRGITHLHHALDACVLAFISHFLPRDGGAWKKEVLELLSKRRCNPTEQAILRATLRKHIGFTPEGQPILQELSKELRQQLCDRLAERRVVQHLPASMADMVSDQTVWRVFDPEDRHENARRLGRWLAEKGIEIPAADAKTVIIITRKRKAAAVAGAPEEKASSKVFHEGNTWRWVYEVKAKDGLLGFAPTGDPKDWKLKPYKAVKVLGDNFGIALDPEPTLIRPLHVWRQVQDLRTRNGGKWPRVVRKGTIIRIEKAKSAKVDYRGVWMVRGLNYKQRDGFIVGLSPADFVPDRRVKGVIESAALKTLLACGLEILSSSLCGVASEKVKPAM